MASARTSVAGIAINDGKIFIARRLPGGAMGEKWEFPGGKAEEGESDRQALVREYDEEFGVSIETGPLLGTASFEHRGVSQTLNAYRIFFTPRDGGMDGPSFTLRAHTEWRWASLEEIEKMDFAGSDRKLFPALKMYLQ